MVLTDTGITAVSTTPSIVTPAFSSNVFMVGSAWVVSSAILTTYSTTNFLKYDSSSSIRSSPPSSFVESTKKNHHFEKTHLTKHAKKNGLMNQIILQQKSLPILDIARPALLTLYRFSGSLFLGIFAHPQILFFHERIQQTLSNMQFFVLPALCLFVANYSNSIALDRIGISLTYTSKCGIPLITVLLTLLVDGMKALPSISILLTLILIAFGIGAASWDSPTFEWIGFLSAMISCTAQAALNVSSKRILRHRIMGGLEAQRTMVAIAFIMACMTQLIRMAIQIIRDTCNAKLESTIITERYEKKRVHSRKHPPLSLSLLAVMSYHIEYVLSFMFVKLVEPVTYGTCDAIRRLSIIITGRKFFGGEPFSRLNISGIGLAILGALLFSIANS